MLGYGRTAERNLKHFNPLDAHFSPRYTAQCAVSVLFIAAWVTGLVGPYGVAFGTWRLVAHYLIPVFVFGSWLVVTTFLHHVEEDVPWYSDERKVSGQIARPSIGHGNSPARSLSQIYRLNVKRSKDRLSALT